MEHDFYKVDVVHIINPHLIWVIVPGSSKDDFCFEQIGIFGVVPLEMTMDSAEDTLVTRRTTEWMPAATVLLKNLFAEAAEIFFYPIPSPQERNSIFDDSPHKFGEIAIKKPCGKIRLLSEQLQKSCVALHDEQLFEHELNSGNIKLKLSYNRTKDVVRHLERRGKKQIEKQTTVFRAAMEVESALTVENLEAHNKRTKNLISIEEKIQQKFEDLEILKNVDMESAGRASSRLSRMSNNSKVSLLKKRLSVLKTDNDWYNHEDQRRERISPAKLETEYVDSDIKTQNTYKFDNNNDGAGMVLTKYPQYDDLKMKFSKEETTSEVEDTHLATKGNEEMFERRQNLSWDCDQEDHVRRNPKPKKHQKSPKLPDYNRHTETRVAFGPPDIDFQKIPQKVVPKEQLYQTSTPVAVKTPDIPAKKEKEDIYENEDSDVEDFHNSGKDLAKTDVVLSNDCFNDPGKSFSGIIDKKHSEIYEYKHIDVSPKSQHEHKENKHHSNSLLKKKLQAHKHFISRNIDSSNSDTSNKDSTTSVEDDTKKIHKLLSPISSQKKSQPQNVPSKNFVSQDLPIKKKYFEIDSDDENMSELIEKLNTEYKPTPKPKLEESYTSHVNLKYNVNPFKNVDPSMSVFVDKLVTPVVMVHSKLDKRISPKFHLRDVPFNTHIQILLRNMGIEKPMMLQTITWGSILRGYSTFVVGPMNSGKTMGYLPAVCSLIADHDSGIDGTGPICVIVCATSSCVAVVEKLSKLFLGAKEKVLAFYTGMAELEMTTALLNGCDLFVCTPSILLRLLQLDLGVDLRSLTTFVLDDCERLSEVYANEIKFFIFKIREMLKVRIAKEVKVQYVLASRIWCDFMEPLLKRAPDPVICIGAFQECVLYSKAKTTASFVTKENKIHHVLQFLQEFDNSKRTVIVCRTNEEVNVLEKALIKEKYVVFACNDTMTVQNLYKLRGSWDDYQEPIIGPILLCCDGNLTHLNVTDAHHLIHFSLPSLFSTFCKRFSVLNDNYSSIFKEFKDNVRINILLEDSNVEQLPKILHFVKRCTTEVPDILDDICDKVLAEKDEMKAKKLVPICDYLLALGECPDFWYCQTRHSVFKAYDVPKDWIPKDGSITFKILHYHTPVMYSARLLSNVTKNKTIDYPQNYNMLAMKIAMYFSRESNQKLLGVPNVGDVCAVSIRQNFFERCQVVKILSFYQNGMPNNVLVRLLDAEKLERTRDIYLFYLPEEMRSVETHCIQVRLAKIQPKDKDISFSDLATKQLKKITDSDEDLYLKGHVALTIGNCVFVDSLETCRDLSSLNKTVVRHDFKQELLENHAIPNPDHLSRLTEICEDGGLLVRKECDVTDGESPVKPRPVKEQWARLDESSLVRFTFAIDPSTFFVRLSKFEEACEMLIKNIEEYASQNPEPVKNVSVKDIVLAKLPDDSLFERARVDRILNDDKVSCFFVDHGDCREIPIIDLLKIPEKLITQLPFQAIECRLVGVKPPGENWTDFAINWFTNLFEDGNSTSKRVFVNYYKIEVAQHTGGQKYAVVLIDTNHENDVVVNNLILSVNLGNKHESEYDAVCQLDAAMTGDRDNKNESDGKKQKSQIPPSKSVNVPLRDIFPEKPIRSVPLIESEFDSEDEDRWDGNYNKDFINMLKQADPELKDNDFISTKLPAINNVQPSSHMSLSEKPEQEIGSAVLNISANGNLEVPARNMKELDSDDLTSPEPTQVSIKSTELSNVSNISSKDDEKTVEEDVLRKPTVLWGQKKANVSIKIMLVGVEKYDMKIKERRLTFDAMANETHYGFDIELYGLVDIKKSNHSNKGQYVLVSLTKVFDRKWLTLTKTNEILRWITYNIDSIDVSSDEEEITSNNAMKHIGHTDHYDTESEDDLIDDCNFKY